MSGTGDGGRPPGHERRAGRKVTIRDVAQEAGVAASTVSYVLNGSAAVAAKTRDHVNAVIARLGYRPNSMARNLRHGVAASVGLVVPELSNPFFAQIAEGAQAAARVLDVLMVLCITDATKDWEDYYTQIVDSRRLDGLLYVTGSGMPTAPLLSLIRDGRVVFVDELLPSLEVSAVVASNRQGALEMGRHIMALGHRRVALIHGAMSLWTTGERRAGFRAAFAEAGLDPNAVPEREGDYRERSGYELAREFLAMPPERRPTALLCGNDLMALGALEACREAGLRVPEEMTITGFDDINLAAVSRPALTTVRIPAAELGRRALALLMEGGDGRMTGVTVEECETSLQLRGTTAKPISRSFA